MVFSTTVPYQLLNGRSPYSQVISQAAFMLLSFAAIGFIFRLKLRALKVKKNAFCDYDCYNNGDAGSSFLL